jgi:hypothetical protein
MTILVSKQENVDLEQIYSNQNGYHVLNSIKTILEKDQFNLFKLKSSIELDKHIAKSNKDIDNLVNLKNQGVDQIELLTNELKELKNKNQQRFTRIGGLLDAN